MLKKMKVELILTVDEDVDATDIKNAKDNLAYLSEKEIEVTNVEFVEWG